MIETLGKLIEEPERRKMYFVFIIKMIFSGVLTSYLYKRFISNYILLKPLSENFYEDLYNFIFTGHILIVFFLFIASSVTLFVVLSSIISLLIGIVYRERLDKKELKDATLVRFILNWTGAVKIDIKSNKVHRGKDFDNFYDMMVQYRKKSFKKAIKSFKNSLINEIMHLYFIFVALFYTIINFPANKFINVLIIVAGLVLLYFHVTLQSLTRFFDVNENNLMLLLRMLKAEEIVNEVIEENNITLTDTEKSYLSPCAKTIEFNSRKIYIDFYAGQRPITLDMKERMCKTKEKHGWSKIFIVNCQMAFVEDTNLSHSDIVIIDYNNDKAIGKKLSALIFEKTIAQPTD